MLRFKGAMSFRQRLMLSTLTGRTICISEIRADDDADRLGLQDYELAFLRLLEKVTNGAQFEINPTGTQVIYKPGLVHGGNIDFECPISRGIGYYLEPLLAIAPFAKTNFSLTLRGVTSNTIDVSVDTIRTNLLPLLSRFVSPPNSNDKLAASLSVKARGHCPRGGGVVVFECTTVRSLHATQILDVGRVKKIRGIASCVRMSPATSMRLVESAKSVLNRYIPDVYIYSDVFKGKESGNSPGFALSLVAESTTGALYSSECAADPTLDVAESAQRNSPEYLARRCAQNLYREIALGGAIDSVAQPLALTLMAMTPEDVSRIKISQPTPQSMQLMRDLKTFTGLVFRVQEESEQVLRKSSDDDDDDYDEEEEEAEIKSVILTCVGVGMTNLGKKVL